MGEDGVVLHADVNAEPPALQLKGCSHYKRRCQIQAKCCGGWFSCHVCHDEYHDTSSTATSAGSCTTHMRGSSNGNPPGRYLIERIRCRACAIEQPVAASCTACQTPFAEYFCAPCRLYADPSTTGIFHCDPCGICRVGTRDAHFHCDTCAACYVVGSKHVCVDRALHSDCPVCFEYMFTSPTALSVGLNCGHAMHPECLERYVRSGRIGCPVCSRPLVDLEPPSVPTLSVWDVARRLVGGFWTPLVAFVVLCGIMMLNEAVVVGMSYVANAMGFSASKWQVRIGTVLLGGLFLEMRVFR